MAVRRYSLNELTSSKTATAIKKQGFGAKPFLGEWLRLVMLNGRDDWIRTSDPLTPSQVRYRAALRPDPLPKKPELHTVLLFASQAQTRGNPTSAIKW